MLSELVVGKKTIGIGFMSLIAHLKNCLQGSGGAYKAVLSSLYDLSVSKSEMCELLHEVARMGRDECDTLLESIRDSPLVHAD